MVTDWRSIRDVPTWSPVGDRFGVMVVGLIAYVRWYRRPADPRYVTAEVTLSRAAGLAPRPDRSAPLRI